MNFARLAPPLPQGGPRRRWGVAASVLLHGAAFLALLGIAARPRPPEAPAGPAYDLVFQSPAMEPAEPGLPPTQPAEAPLPDALPGAPAPPPSSAPDPEGVASPLPETAAVPPPAPAEAAPPLAAAPAPQEAAAAPPAPATPAAPPVEASVPPPPQPEPVPQQEPAAPAIRLELPPPPEPPERLAEIMPRPPPPQTAPAPTLARPRPPQPARAAPGTLANPMNLDFAEAHAAPRPAARGAARGINLAIGTPGRSAERSVTAATADWFAAVHAHWLNHRYYPRMAADSGQDGTVVIQLTVSPAGRVQAVEIVAPSGSQWLDMAAVGAFRGAQLPPPPELGPSGAYVQRIPITYYLIRH